MIRGALILATGFAIGYSRGILRNEQIGEAFKQFADEVVRLSRENAPSQAYEAEHDDFTGTDNTPTTIILKTLETYAQKHSIDDAGMIVFVRMMTDEPPKETSTP